MSEPLTLLIIDDDDVFRAVLKRSFERKGWQVCDAATSDAALQALSVEEPEYCVLDMKLGHESGLHLLPKLLAASPQLQVVVLTGYASIATAVEAVKMGAINYLSKPVAAAEIVQALLGEQTVHEADVVDAQPMSVDRLEWEHIQKVLAEHDGNISATARALNMHRRTLQRKLQKRPVKR